MSTSGTEETDRLEERLAPLLESGDTEAIQEALDGAHPSDVADLVESLAEGDRLRFLDLLPTDVASETLAEMDGDEHPEELLADMEPSKAAALLLELEDDDAADLVGDLEPADAEVILSALPAEEAGEIRDLLTHDEETAGGLMTRDLVKVRAHVSAERAIEEVRRQGREVEDFFVVFVVDEDDRLQGSVPLDDLILADPQDSVDTVTEPVVASVLPDVDQEDVGRLMSRYNIPVIPVVDLEGRLLGRVTFDDVIDVLEAEQTEDLLRLAGVSEEEELKGSWNETVRSRLPWLLLNLVTASLAALVVRAYEGTIEQVVILAFLMPIIAALGGNAGTQALAVTLRRIALTDDRVSRRPRVVSKEVLVGIVNGMILGIGIAVIAILASGDYRMGGVVLAAMWGTLILAGFSGAFIPTLLDRMGVDPAVASAVFLHTITDFFGFFLLLGLATRFLL
jgi:magnesium transporter